MGECNNYIERIKELEAENLEIRQLVLEGHNATHTELIKELTAWWQSDDDRIKELREKVRKLEAERDLLKQKVEGYAKLLDQWPVSLGIVTDDRDRMKHREREMEAENARLRKIIEDAPKPPMAWNHTALTQFATNYEDWWKARTP